MSSELSTQLETLYKSVPRLLGNCITSLYERGGSGHWQDVRSTSLALTALIASGEDGSSEWIQAGARWLTHKQRANGSWEDEVWDTTECLTALNRSKINKDFASKAMISAKAWLLNMQNEESNWHEEPWETSLAILTLVDLRTKEEEELLQKGIKWLLELQDPNTGRLVNHHYTALLAITLRDAILSGLVPEQTVVKELKLAQSFLCNDLATRTIWTEEVWSNSLCLSAIIPLNLADMSSLYTCEQAVSWYENTLLDLSWNDIDVEDTALAVIGFWNLLEYVLVCMTSSELTLPLLLRELSRSQIEQQTKTLVKPYIHHASSPRGREFLFFEGEALVIPSFQRRLRIFSLVLAGITILTTLLTFGQQIGDFFESLIRAIP